MPPQALCLVPPHAPLAQAVLLVQAKHQEAARTPPWTVAHFVAMLLPLLQAPTQNQWQTKDYPELQGAEPALMAAHQTLHQAPPMPSADDLGLHHRLGLLLAPASPSAPAIPH